MAYESAFPWSLTIPSDLRLLGLARCFVEGVCRVAGFDERATNAIVLATDEATNNIIRHAHCDNPDAPLQIQCYFTPDGRISIRRNFGSAAEASS
jgi:anti-sigma regulatory factor (Ser/Thr protein kinase)